MFGLRTWVSILLELVFDLSMGEAPRLYSRDPKMGLWEVLMQETFKKTSSGEAGFGPNLTV